MTKSYYTEYVRHALRFYTRNLLMSRFKSEADKDNWYACANVIKAYSDQNRDIIIKVYSGYDTLSDNVFEAARRYNVNQSVVWDLMKEVEHKIAKRRGLI